jgi:Cof subfamily protein (haloacid dehalogenase superfamily)
MRRLACAFQATAGKFGGTVVAEVVDSIRQIFQPHPRSRSMTRTRPNNINFAPPLVPATGGTDISLIALDMDGTLLNPREDITPRVHHALHRAMELGVQIVLATARPPRAVRFYHRALKLRTPIISHNGALIWDERAQCVLRHSSLPQKMVKRVIDFARKRRPDVIPSVEIIDTLYSDHFGIVPVEAIPPGRRFSPDVIADMSSFLHSPVTRVMFHAPAATLDHLTTDLTQKFKSGFSLLRSEHRLLQVVAPDTDKAVALEIVSGWYNVPPSKVLAIGDGPNDVPMLRWAGISVAMANAPERVRKVARHVVPSNGDDGVAVALEKFVLCAA